jgi:hypothetical protein
MNKFHDSIGEQYSITNENITNSITNENITNSIINENITNSKINENITNDQIDSMRNKLNELESKVWLRK